jgi:hypothetical protein
MNTHLRNPSAFFFLALLSACGGGTGPAPQMAQVEISAATAPAVAAAVLDAAIENGELQDLANLAALSGGATSALATDPNMAMVVVSAENQPCAVDGSADFTYDIDDPTQIGFGDSITANFVDCDDGNGVILNGGFGFTITEISGDLSGTQFMFGFSTVLESFSMTKPGEMVEMSGTVGFFVDTLTPPLTVIGSSGSVLHITDGGVSTSLFDFVNRVTLDESAPSVTVQASGQAASSEFDGVATFDTTVPFQILGADQYPSSGELLVEGANDVDMMLIALNNTDVDIVLDLDANGSFETTIHTTWAALNT